MNKKTAGLSFLGICFVLAILLLTKVISTNTSAIIFAVTLVIFGILSKSFTRTE